MTELVVIELIRTVPSLLTLLGVLFGIWATLENRRVTRATSKVVEDKVAVVELHTNGLLAQAKSESKALGVEEGHAAGVVTGIAVGIDQERHKNT